MFDDEHKTSVWVVFLSPSTDEGDMYYTPRRLANVSFDPDSEVNIFALKAALSPNRRNNPAKED
jgi:hypothetical protein